jgi:hypothetical protein
MKIGPSNHFAFVVLLGLLSFPLTLYAQSTYYVRAGATGANNGTDWNNAYTNLPSSLVRGATYYVADGSYGSYVFDDAEDGTKWITIKKATVADHGTSTGWLDSYGDGQAVFTQFGFGRSYYELNGQTRNESDWKAGASYGIRVQPPNGSIAIAANRDWHGGAASHLRFYYLDIGGAEGSVYPDIPSGAFYIVYDLHENIQIRSCYIHHVGLPFKTVEARAVTLERCYIGPSWSKELIRAGGGTYNDGWIIRNNICVNNGISSTEGQTAEIGVFAESGNNDNWEISGNVFHDTGEFTILHNNAAIMADGNTRNANNWKVFNNTFIGLGNGLVRIFVTGTNNAVHNNLWYASQPDGQVGITLSSATSTASNNWVSAGSNGLTTMTNSYPTTIVGTADPFVSYTTGNYNLTAGSQARNVGRTLGAGFSATDINGTTRGADGTWDVGAFEYASSGPVAPTILTQPQSVTVTVGNSATFTVTAGGTAPLSYQWQRDGSDLPEAEATSYTHPSATLSDNGATFRVIVSNSAGSTTSQVATLTVTSTPNQSPTVSLTAPTNNATYTAPAAMTLAASAADSDGSVAKVEFFNGGTKLGEDTTSPYTYAWSGVGAGSYSLTARATDNLGATTTSAAVNVTVTNTTTTAFSIGERVMVNVDPSLRVRDTAALDGTVLGTQAYQALGTVTAGPVSADGYTWWQIDYDADPDGWSIEGDGTTSWLIRATEAPPPPPTGLIVQ